MAAWNIAVAAASSITLLLASCEPQLGVKGELAASVDSGIMKARRSRLKQTFIHAGAWGTAR
jgi:hypothetical protein